MRTLSTLTLLGLSAQLSTASYVLKDDYGNTASFFDNFSFYTATDPTHGFVRYVDRGTAESGGLISANDGSVYVGVDHKNKASGGRQSVRLTSSNRYTHGLVILDLEHMPGGTCGTWPAFWMLGSNWPNNGEIDIIEGVNDGDKNQMTLHTSDGCTINNSGFAGSLMSGNCYVGASGQSANQGCAISASSPQTYGSQFNKQGGGVYATEWTSDAISIWFFPNSSVPSDITSGEPDTSKWGAPQAHFTGCNIDGHFNSMQLVFDNTFCGDWAGGAWRSSSCASKASTCEDYVTNNPSDFKDAYWAINSLKVYQSASTHKRDNAHNHGHVHARRHQRGQLGHK